MWFMNSLIGLFLFVVGYWDGDKGSGIIVIVYINGIGSYYWSSDFNGNLVYGFYIFKNDVFVDVNGNRKFGVFVWCVYNF